MTTSILNEKQISSYQASAAAALEMAGEMLQHRGKISAVVSAALSALQNQSGDVLPLLQILEDLAFDTDQDVRLIKRLEAMERLV
jgi:hypothetical protein